MGLFQRCGPSSGPLKSAASSASGYGESDGESAGYPAWRLENAAIRIEKKSDGWMAGEHNSTLQRCRSLGSSCDRCTHASLRIGAIAAAATGAKS
jgi:hypothetical protein